MSRRIHRRLFVEELEPRISPALVPFSSGSAQLAPGDWAIFDDASGDTVRADYLAGPVASTVTVSLTGGANDNADITTIVYASADSTSNVRVDKTAGAGTVTAGDVTASGQTIGTLEVEGSIASLTAGTIASGKTVTAKYGGAAGSIGNMTLSGDLLGSIYSGGNIGNIIVTGRIGPAGGFATIDADGDLKDISAGSASGIRANIVADGALDGLISAVTTNADIVGNITLGSITSDTLNWPVETDQWISRGIIAEDNLTASITVYGDAGGTEMARNTCVGTTYSHYGPCIGTYTGYISGTINISGDLIAFIRAGFRVGWDFVNNQWQTGYQGRIISTGGITIGGDIKDTGGIWALEYISASITQGTFEGNNDMAGYISAWGIGMDASEGCIQSDIIMFGDMSGRMLVGECWVHRPDTETNPGGIDELYRRAFPDEFAPGGTPPTWFKETSLTGNVTVYGTFSGEVDIGYNLNASFSANGYTGDFYIYNKIGSEGDITITGIDGMEDGSTIYIANGIDAGGSIYIDTGPLAGLVTCEGDMGGMIRVGTAITENPTDIATTGKILITNSDPAINPSLTGSIRVYGNAGILGEIYIEEDLTGYIYTYSDNADLGAAGKITVGDDLRSGGYIYIKDDILSGGQIIINGDLASTRAGGAIGVGGDMDGAITIAGTAGTVTGGVGNLGIVISGEFDGSVTIGSGGSGLLCDVTIFNSVGSSGTFTAGDVNEDATLFKEDDGDVSNIDFQNRSDPGNSGPGAWWVLFGSDPPPGYYQDFSSGKPVSSKWSYYSSAAGGRIEVVDGALRMVSNGTYNLNEAILHLNLEGMSNFQLEFKHRDSKDEPDAMPTGTWAGHAIGDGVAISDDGGITWHALLSLGRNTDWTTYTIDLDQAVADAGMSYTADFLIKFQQYDNHWWGLDGREFDDVAVIVVSPPPVNYAQDFSSGKPREAEGWQYYSSGGRIEVIDGALRMDSNGTSSLNEAILTLNLVGQSNVQLQFTHRDSADEFDAMPTGTWTGHQNGDGVAISDDGGATWFTIGSLGRESGWTLHTINLDQAVAAAGMSYTSNFLIKLQQYDNQAWGVDGREFDNISVKVA